MLARQQKIHAPLDSNTIETSVQCTAFFRPDRCNGPIVYSYKPLPGAEDEIYRRISDITISMRSTDYLKMPDLIESAHEVEMDTSEAKHYKDMKKDLILQLPEGEVTAANAASLSNKLCQMANGAVYADDGIHGSYSANP